MALNANKQNDGGKKFAPQANVAAGVYPGRLVQLIDLGLQPQKPFKGEPKKPVQELMWTYELVDEFMKDEDGKDIVDKPRWISETLPFHGLFADKAKSTQRYHAFDPQETEGGDWVKFIGAPCNVAVVNNPVGDKVYDNIGAISAMRPRDAAACPPLVNPTKVFDLDAPDMAVFNSLPKWIQDKIKGNLNFQGSPLQAALGEKKEAPAKKTVAADADVDHAEGIDNNQDVPY